MKKLLIGIAAVALLAVGVSPALAGWGYVPPQSAELTVHIQVQPYYKIWVTPVDITVMMDPGLAWEGEAKTTLSYFACVQDSVVVPIHAQLDVTQVKPDLRLHVMLIVNGNEKTKFAIEEPLVPYDWGEIANYVAGDPIHHDDIIVRANIGQGIPKTLQDALTGTLTFTIAPQ